MGHNYTNCCPHSMCTYGRCIYLPKKSTTKKKG